MNKFVRIMIVVLLCAFAMPFLSGCGRTTADARREKYDELVRSGMSGEEASKWLDEHQEEWHPSFEYSRNQKNKTVPKGHWELKATEVDPNSDLVSESSSSCFTVTQTSHKLDYTYGDDPDVMNGENFSGSYAITCSDLPETFKVGDTISVELHAEALSFSDTKRVQSFSGMAVFQGEDDFKDLDFDKTDPVYVGIMPEVNPDDFNKTDKGVYNFVLEEKYAGKMTTFWILFGTNAGESCWEYDWVND